ncbi:DUF3382 domain-containing protein [Siccirubricoccus deserti]
MPIPRALRDAAIAAAIAFGLFAVMVGLRTEVSPTGALVLRQRWAEVAMLCGIVFAGRLALTLWLGRRALRPTTAPGPGPSGCSRPGDSSRRPCWRRRWCCPSSPAATATCSTSAFWC